MNPSHAALAAMINANCAAHSAGLIDRAAWSVEQHRIYALAARSGSVCAVLALVIGAGS
jgi:hypothetical protein